MLAQETMYRLYYSYSTGIPFTQEEFMEDSKRIVLVARALDRWINDKSIDMKLVANHIIIIQNVFGDTGSIALYEYISNFPELKSSALALLYYIGIINCPAVFDIGLYEHLEEIYNE